MVTETGEPVLEELTQELERANQEILRLKGYAVPSASVRARSTGLASSASAEGKAVRLRGIAISEGTHNGKYYPWEELSKDSFVDSFIGKPVVVDHKEGLPSEVGLVKAARKDLEQKAILVDLEIYDEARGKQALYLMEHKRPVGLSVQVWERVSHEDGMRVRASAGASSFRRAERLKECLRLARERVEQMAKEREHPDPMANLRQQRARERAARERAERVKQALEYMPRAQAAKERQLKSKAIRDRAKVTEPRASTTDPEARVMKMPDGGFRPAYNVGLATDQANGVIIGVTVTAQGTDAGQAAPMEQQVAKRTGKRPQAYLMDGGFASSDDITPLAKEGITVYAPVKLPKRRPETERYEPRYGDTPEVVRWRQRMATDEAKEVYRQRGAIAEWTNAQVRQHGVSQFTVRGLAKVTNGNAVGGYGPQFASMGGICRVSAMRGEKGQAWVLGGDQNWPGLTQPLVEAGPMPRANPMGPF